MRILISSIKRLQISSRASPVALVVKNPPASARDPGDMGSNPGLGIFPRRGNGKRLQYSFLENPMDTGGWPVTVAKELDMVQKLNNNTTDIFQFSLHGRKTCFTQIITKTHVTIKPSLEKELRLLFAGGAGGWIGKKYENFCEK